MQAMASIDVGAYVIGLTKARREAVVRAIQTTCEIDGIVAIQRVIDATKPPPVDRGTERHGYKVKRLGDGAMIYNPVKYSPIVNFGRRPGKMPPIDAIADWVIRKGLVAKARGKAKWDQRREAVQIAWLIARKIAAKGIEGKHILDRAKGLITSAVMLAARAAAEGRG